MVRSISVNQGWKEKRCHKGMEVEKEGKMKGHKTVATNLITDISTLKWWWPILLWKVRIVDKQQVMRFYVLTKKCTIIVLLLRTESTNTVA